MQLTCPQCQTLLEIPDHVTGVDVLHIECGACQRRFKLQLNRPSLKVRKPLKTSEHRSDDAFREPPAVADVLLTTAPDVEGRQIEAPLGEISSFVTLAGSEGERQADMLDALARAQTSLREQARALGADGVVQVQTEHLATEQGPVLRLSGTAVHLFP